jgi:DNA mismatch repair protein MutS2
LQNIKQASIIHGYGTGVIRELVQKMLKENRNVEAFRYGGQGEGGSGATIVTFK